ncbi:hypothetical protein KEJ49_03355 [Candidatus Bathyarchaeota archaeon]|nr:hypothetical protein [Candidatus Bathyarchaeota archaeon]
MNERERIAYYLSEAERFAEAAMAEFERWEEEKIDVIIRDAAEKGWNMVLQATKALLLGKGFPEERIKTHRDRRLALDSLKNEGPKVRSLGLRDRFGAREHHLHERCLYDGEYIPKRVEEDILIVKSILRML